MAKRITDEHGPPDIVVSNAGKSIRRSLHHQYERPHDFDRTIGIHPTAAEEFVTMRTRTREAGIRAAAE